MTIFKWFDELEHHAGMKIAYGEVERRISNTFVAETYIYKRH
jgi:hypothetical protein